MQITSFYFYIFVLSIVLFYYSIFKKHQKVLVCLVSTLFYCSYDFKYFIFLLVSATITFLCAKKISENNINKQQTTNNKRILMLGIFFVLILLISTKYFNFITLNFVKILSKFNIGIAVPSFSIIVPLGISFYTFMNLGYLLDVYWKKYPAEKSFFKYFLFISYFPHIVQGPISRYNELAPQFLKNKKFDFKQILFGFERMLWGLFKKMVIADRLNIFVSEVYENWEGYSFTMIFIATLFFSIQIYADFSGCMDILGGISEMLGIELKKNFNHPYFAKTMPEFWRRWHMSLMEWFRDYVYYPVSTSNIIKSTSKKIKNKFGAKVSRNFIIVSSGSVVWLITGLWHGASWKYVAWGAFHAALINFGVLFGDQIKKLTVLLQIKTNCFSWRLFQMSRTFILCTIGRIFFRAGSLMTALQIFKKTKKSFRIWELFDGSIYDHGLDILEINIVILCIFIFIIISIMQEKFSIREKLLEQNIIFRAVILYIAIFSIIIFGIYGSGYNAADFIYGQF